MKVYKFLLIIIILLFSNLTQSQSVFAKWKTIDDRTGDPKAIINIYEKEGLMFGEVSKIVEPGKENSFCTKCDGDMKDLSVIGMTIIKDGIKNTDNQWKGKFLFDPEQAMTFRFKIWLNPDNSNELKVRGYLAFLFRTQTWLRVDE